jgi:hypothetical protein
MIRMAMNAPASLRSENSGTENGGDFEDAPDSVANFHRERLVDRALYNRLTGRIDKRAERHTVRRFGVRQFDTLDVRRKGIRRPEVQKIMRHVTELTSVAATRAN